MLQAFKEKQGAKRNQAVSRGESQQPAFAILHPPPCLVSSHLTLFRSISCPWVSLSLPRSAFFFSLLSFLLRAVPCNHLVFPSPRQEIPDAGFPWDAHWQGKHSTCSVHPARSCSQQGKEARAGALKLRETLVLFAAAQPHRSLLLLLGALIWKILVLKTQKQSGQCPLCMCLMPQWPCYL